MKSKERLFNCKDEELPVICEFALNNMKRDAADFVAYSPKFNEEYIAEFETMIAEVNALVNPRGSTADMKVVTARLYATMGDLTVPVNHMEGYLKLAGSDIPLSVADFGIKNLRSKLHKRDAEGVLGALRLLTANISKYITALTAVGFSEVLAAQFASAATSIAADNAQQYSMLTSRKEQVQANIEAFNALYARLMEFCNVGKLIYKNIKPEKLAAYTFAELLKKVRKGSAKSREEYAE